MFAELRLRSGSGFSTTTVLRNAASVTFGVVNADVGTISFTLPFADAQNLGVAVNSVIEVLPNGVSAPNLWFEIDSSSVTQTIDGASLYQFSGKGLIQWFNDGIVYPSTWNDPAHNLDQYTISTTGTVTTTIPKISAANQVQTVTIFGAPTGGTFTLTYNGNTTSAIPRNVTPSALATYINSITATSTVSVIGTAGVSYSVTLPASITKPKLMTAVSSLTGGTSPSVTVIPSTALTANSTIAGYSFENATPGFIVRTLVARCVERGGFSWLDVSSFSGPTDSAGTAWPSVISTNYATGTTLLQVIQDLVTRQLIDFSLVGTALNVYIKGTQNTHYAADQITFRRGKHFTEQTRTIDGSDGATAVLIQGDLASIEEVTDTSLLTALGRRREKYVSQSGITDLPTLALIANAQLKISGHLQTEDSVATTDLNILPWVNYQVGDWVWADFDGTLKNIQIQQISAAQQDAGNLSIGLTLGDLLLSRDEKNQLLIDAITGGNGSVSNGTPTQTTNNVPSAPTGLTANTTAYRDANGIDYAQVTLSWNAPTTNTDGTILSDLDHYEIRYQIGSSASWTLAANVPGSTNPTATYLSALPAGQSFTSQVRAVDSDRNASLWATQTNTVSTLPTYTGTLTTPSTPSVTPIIQGFTVSWDGLDYQGNSYDKSFSQINIYVSTTSGFTPSASNLAGSMTSRGGTLSFTGYAYGTTYYVAFIAVDKSANYSPASTQSAGVVPAKAGTGDVTGLGTTSVYTQSSAPTTANTNDLWINTSNGNAIYKYSGSSWVLYQFGTGSLAVGTISATDGVIQSLSAGTIVSGALSSATITITTGGYINVGTPGTAGIQLSASGLTGWNASAQTFNLSSAGVLTIGSATVTGTLVGASIKTASAYPYISMGPNTGDVQTLSFVDTNNTTSQITTKTYGGTLSTLLIVGPGASPANVVSGTAVGIQMTPYGMSISSASGGGIVITPGSSGIQLNGSTSVNNLNVSAGTATITSSGYGNFVGLNIGSGNTILNSSGAITASATITGSIFQCSTSDASQTTLMIKNNGGGTGLASNTSVSPVRLVFQVGNNAAGYITSSGNMVITGTYSPSSTLRHKYNIQKQFVSPDLVDRIRFVSYQSTHSVEAFAEERYGVIAEELAQYADLNRFVQYDQGKAEAVAYMPLTLAAIMSVNKKYEEKFKALEAQIAELKNG